MLVVMPPCIFSFLNCKVVHCAADLQPVVTMTHCPGMRVNRCMMG